VLFDDVTALISAQRDAAWGEVARRLAHEIKNPLTPIQLSAERLRRKYLKSMPERDAQVLERATHTIVQQVEAMKRMVNDFSEYARPPKMELKLLQADDLIDEIVDLYRGEKTVDFTARFQAPGARVEADPIRVRQILHNLVKNALEAVANQQDGRVWISTQTIQRDDRPFFELRVEDNGPGFSDEMLQRLFEPYVTSKPKGTGLGLAIVKKIVEEHGGMIWAENSADGACMVVQLPVLAEMEEQEA
jgi:nitrogen fixation/metabolism regulation signal transduction histidine kinase